MQAGAFWTCDDGQNWNKIPGSQSVPAITDFSFTNYNYVVISSYGRGLWTFRFPDTPCFPVRLFPIEHTFPNSPVIYWNGTIIPLSQLLYNDICPRCAFILTKGGDINGYTMNKENNAISELELSGGKISGYNAHLENIALPFKMTISNRKYNDPTDSLLMQILKAKNMAIKGLYMEGSTFNGLILSDADLDSTMVPHARTIVPELYVDLHAFDRDNDKVKKATVVGTGFNSTFPVTFILDGEILRPDSQIRYNSFGVFIQVITLPIKPGRHVLLAEQPGGEKNIRARFSFFVPFSEGSDGH